MSVDLSELHAPRGSVVRILGPVLGLAIVYSFIPLQDELWWVGMIVGLAALGAITPFAFKRVAAISTSPHPGLAAAEAITMLATMLVLGFAGVYLSIDRHHDQFVGLSTKVDAVYFTVTTLSTVGFGDIHAAGQTARTIVTLQIIMDLTLVAVLVRLLVGAARGRVHR